MYSKSLLKHTKSQLVSQQSVGIMSLQYSMYEYEVIQVDFWRYKTKSGQIFCLLENLLNFLDNPDYYRTLTNTRLTPENTRQIENFSNFIPLGHTLITPGSLFINADGLKILFYETENNTKREWVLENIYEYSLERIKQNNELVAIFKEFKELFEKKVKGHNLSFFAKTFFSLWTRLVNYGEHEQWVRKMTFDLASLEFEKTYLLFNEFNDRFLEYNIQYIITKMIMFLNGKITFDPDNSLKNNKMFSIVKHKNHEHTPFHMMSLSTLKKPRKKPKFQDTEEMAIKQLEACKLMHKNTFKKPNFDQLIKLGDPLSLNDTNAGAHFKMFEGALQSHSQFLLEIANREISGYATTYAIITTEFNNEL